MLYSCSHIIAAPLPANHAVLAVTRAVVFASAVWLFSLRSLFRGTNRRSHEQAFAKLRLSCQARLNFRNVRQVQPWLLPEQPELRSLDFLFRGC